MKKYKIKFLLDTNMFEKRFRMYKKNNMIENIGESKITLLSKNDDSTLLLCANKKGPISFYEKRLVSEPHCLNKVESVNESRMLKDSIYYHTKYRDSIGESVIVNTMILSYDLVQKAIIENYNIFDNRRNQLSTITFEFDTITEAMHFLNRINTASKKSGLLGENITNNENYSIANLCKHNAIHFQDNLRTN